MSNKIFEHLLSKNALDAPTHLGNSKHVLESAVLVDDKGLKDVVHVVECEEAGGKCGVNAVRKGLVCGCDVLDCSPEGVGQVLQQRGAG